jgi:hypothetical protein
MPSTLVLADPHSLLLADTHTLVLQLEDAFTNVGCLHAELTVGTFTATLTGATWSASIEEC